MTSEAEIGIARESLYQERTKIAVANLQKKNINAKYASNRQEALSSVLEMIPGGVKVVCGDSITMDQVGVITALRKRNQNTVMQPMERDAKGSYVIAEREQRLIMQREAFTADVFLTGTNAVTLDGKLVSTDGLGNRVSAVIFGPEKVIIVAGANKIVKDVNEALERIREVAAPMNAIRHYLSHKRVEYADLPCVRTGVCNDCNHDWRICRYTVIIEGTMLQAKGRINVVIVGEELGL